MDFIRETQELNIDTILNDMNEQKAESFKTKEDITKDTFIAITLMEGEYLLRRMEALVMQFRRELLQSEYLDGAFSMIKNREGYYKRELIEQECNIFNLKIIYHAPAMELHIPALMPHRASRPGLFYEDTLSAYLDTFKNQNLKDFKEYKESIKDGACIFVKSFMKSKFLIKDSDNLSLKAVIDTLVRYQYLKEDKGTYLSLHILTEYDKNYEDITIIYLVPKKYGVSFMSNLIESKKSATS